MYRYYILVFILQLIGYIQSIFLKSERYYDVFGCGTFVIVGFISLVGNYDSISGHLTDKSYLSLKRSLLVSLLIIIWSGRLLVFLNDRMKKNGRDKRFDNVRTNPKTFGIYWFMQSLWINFTITPMLMLSYQHFSVSLSTLDYALLLLWTFAFVMEITADVQKTLFLQSTENKGKFINVGLWKYIRHPNYFAEIVMHWSIYFLCVRGINGIQHQLISLIAPLFITFLMFKIATPMLEKSANDKFKLQPQYQTYKKSTYILIPFLY